jgi:hypothetical protein
VQDETDLDEPSSRKTTDTMSAVSTDNAHPRFVRKMDSSNSPHSNLHPYTVRGLAKFLGNVMPDGTPLESFEAAFGAQ